MARDGEPITDDDLAEVLAGIALVEPLLENRPSWFELVTAAAFRWFAEAPVDVAVVEVGLLGRYDATNVVDGPRRGRHQRRRRPHRLRSGLGAGDRVREGRHHQARTRPWSSATWPTTCSVCSPRRAPPSCCATATATVDFGVLDDRVAVGGHVVDAAHAPKPCTRTCSSPLHGRHQVDNAAIALAAVEAFFGRPVDDDVVAEAFATLELPGRFEVVGHEPLVILDGAHNPDALRALARTLDEEFTPVGSRLVVVGMLQGRDLATMGSALAELRPDLVICTTSPGDRGVDARTLAAACDAAGLPNEWAADPATRSHAPCRWRRRRTSSS